MFKLDFNLYGFIILISFLLGILVIVNNSYDKKYSKVDTLILVIYIIIGFIFGGKIYTYISSNQETFNLLKLGLSSLGSLIGSFIMITIYKFQFKKKIKDLLYILVPAVILMYAVGKIGCFFTGCCLGLKYTGIGHVFYKYSSHVTANYSYFPIQLIESIVFLGIFIYIYFIKKNSKYDIYKLMIVCFSVKFVLDFFRLDHETIFISFNQITCLIFIIIICLFLYLNKRKSLHKH